MHSKLLHSTKSKILINSWYHLNYKFSALKVPRLQNSSQTSNILYQWHKVQIFKESQSPWWEQHFFLYTRWWFIKQERADPVECFFLNKQINQSRHQQWHLYHWYHVYLFEIHGGINSLYTVNLVPLIIPSSIFQAPKFLDILY